MNDKYNDNNVDDEVIDLNIQPKAGILNVFSRLSYKPWYAIAEFVDNSTQSYISHESILEKDENFDKLIVKINYDSENNALTIKDNAYGMELERFKDAILLDSKNDSQSGRNEFGMGLKTAASWFGNVWSVESTQYGSNNKYFAEVNIPQLRERDINNIKIYKEHVDIYAHGTEIKISQVTKKISAPRTIGKIRDLLSSMYRRDINKRNIEIWFNNEPIFFEEYPILTDFRGQSWKKNINFDIEFSEKKYNVTGFVAIMNPGSFQKAGFALFRQDRVVIGGTDENYKPSEIFQQAQSQISLKLFGELNMNDFPVNQAKDGFVWDDGLEDVFIKKLKENIQEYIDIAKLSRKQRTDETQYSEKNSEELRDDVSKKLSGVFIETKGEDDIEIDKKDNNVVKKYINTFIDVENNEKLVGTKRKYHIPTSDILTVDFSVQWAIGTNDYWIQYDEIEKDNYNVLINIDHPFFMPFSKNEDFKRILEQFTIAFILSEREARKTSNQEGYIHANVIKNYMNKFLKRLAEEK